LTSVGAQLCSKLLGSAKFAFQAERASPVEQEINYHKQHSTTISKEKILNLTGI